MNKKGIFWVIVIALLLVGAYLYWRYFIKGSTQRQDETEPFEDNTGTFENPSVLQPGIYAVIEAGSGKGSIGLGNIQTLTPGLYSVGPISLPGSTLLRGGYYKVGATTQVNPTVDVNLIPVLKTGYYRVLGTYVQPGPQIGVTYTTTPNNPPQFITG